MSIILVTILAADELFFYFRVFTPHSVLSKARSNVMVRSKSGKLPGD